MLLEGKLRSRVELSLILARGGLGRGSSIGGPGISRPFQNELRLSERRMVHSQK